MFGSVPFLNLTIFFQLNLKARRSARNYANQIARAVCKYVGPQICEYFFLLFSKT